LEDTFALMLVNPQHFRAVPGRKTDQKDCEWLAQLLQYGLLRGSFVPPQEIRELRELTRNRVKLLGQRNQVHNRIEKLLQQANVKLSSVATDILGVTGRSILAGLLGGNEDAKSLADCAKGTLRRKKDQLEQALQAKLTSHQRFMLREFLDDLKFVEGKIARLEETIQERVTPHEEVLNRLNTIPGINRLTASTLIAELGVAMQKFPDAMHLASWAGLCPGNCESAGKRKNHAYPQRKPACATRAVPSRVGCCPHEALVSVCSVLSNRLQSRPQQGPHRCRTTLNRDRPSPHTRPGRVPRPGRELPR
jgi:transposase